MKRSAFNPLMTWLFFVLLMTVPGLQAAETSTASGPVAMMPETVYQFPDTIDGQYVVHDFVIQNRGTSALNVKVKTT